MEIERAREKEIMKDLFPLFMIFNLSGQRLEALEN